MRKEKTPSFLTRKSLLTSKEESEYQANKGSIQRRRFLNENKALSKQNRYEQRNENYNKSLSGRFSRGVTKGINIIRNPTKSIYNQPKSNLRIGKSGRGRPVGTTKYFDDNGRPIGVYEARKILATKNYIARQQALQRATINPQQQAILNQIRARQNYDAQDMEKKIFPDTRGMVDIDSITKEINDATNIFP